MNRGRVVWKFSFSPGGESLVVEVPPTSTVALFALQGDAFCVWIDRPVEPPADAVAPEERVFLIRGTGDPTPEGSWIHRGSTLVAEGRFVFHLYERSRA